jgi:hypothetical protein
MSGTPAFWAKTLRAQAQMDADVPLDVEELAKWCRIRIDEIPLEGFLGLLMKVGKKSGMLLKAGQGWGQRRFTIAHEIGHFAIPSHQGRPIEQCLEEDVVGFHPKNSTEVEANQFAAELLMPRSLFDLDIRNKTPSFQHIRQLAERYDVSITACGLRWIELTHECAALICVEDGRVKWKRLSRGLRYSLTPSGTRVAPETLVAAVQRGEASSGALEAVPPWAWLERPPERTEVLESAFAIPSLNQVLSLILVEDEVDEDENY